jgi:hypothetical protein
VTRESFEVPPRRAGRDVTVCVGCLCNQKRRLGAIVLGLDRRVTYMAGATIVGKHDLTSKLFQLPFGFAGAVAGTVPDCERFISFLWEYMEQLKDVAPPIQLDHIHHVVQHAQFQVILSQFENALVTKLGLTRQEWLDRRSDTGLRLEGRELLKKIKPDFSCLIAGFLERCPVLMRVVRNNPAEEIVSHSAIGIGARFAMEKLASRTQGPYCTIQRTALALSEALRYAKRKSRPYVGPPAYCVVLEPGEGRQFDPQSTILREWSKTIKAKNTEVLDGDEYWNQFSPILVPIPRKTKQPVSQTAGQGP